MEVEVEAENEGLDPALNLLQASQQFKDHVFRQRLQAVANSIRSTAEEVTTSDIQEEIEEIVEDSQAHADFSVECYTRIFVNKRLFKRRTLPNSTRDSLDLASIEASIWEDLNIAARDGNGDINLLQQTAFVRTGTGKGGRTHDLEDFGFREEACITGMLTAIHQQHPRSTATLTIEVRAELQASRKRKSLDSDTPILSSPPVPQAKRTRTGKLEEQQALRLDKIQLAGDFHMQLAQRFRCEDKGCTNLDNYCFPNPEDKKIHYNITHVHHQTWAQAISRGEATLLQPPLSIYEYWKRQQGAVSRESRAPIRATFQQETRLSLESIQEQINQAQLQNELRAERDRTTQHQEREDECQWRREEKEDERQR